MAADGLMSARGAADFLTRATAVLAVVFVSLSILLAVLAASSKNANIDTSLARPAGQTAPANPPVVGPAAPPAQNPATPSNGQVPFGQ